MNWALMGTENSRKPQASDFHAVPDFVIFRIEYLHFLGANLHIIFFNLTYYLNFLRFQFFITIL